jgi:hypothetical protein
MGFPYSLGGMSRMWWFWEGLNMAFDIHFFAGKQNSDHIMDRMVTGEHDMQSVVVGAQPNRPTGFLEGVAHGLVGDTIGSVITNTGYPSLKDCTFLVDGLDVLLGGL